VQKTIFLYLIIYTCFSTGLFCQNLQLKINGASDFETTVIDSLGFKKNHENYASIKTEVESLQKILFQIGFIENELKFINKLNDSVFSAKINLKTKYKTISVYYDKSLIDSKLLSGVSKEIFEDHFKLDFSEVENVLTYINSKISEKGFPFSKLRLSNIEVKDETNLIANLVLESSEQKRTISNIIIKGYEKFPRSYLKHYLKIKPSQTFNLNVIKNRTAQLNNLKFASEAKSPEVLFSKDSTTLYLYLNKTKSNLFDGFLGFGTNEDTNKLEFDGFINLSLTNNLNYGESFKLLYKSDENDQKTFETSLSLPYIFKTPIGLDFLLRIFKRDSSFTTVNQSAKLHYQINPKHKIYTGILSTQSNNLLDENITATIFDYRTNYYTIAYQFIKNQTNNLLFPINSHLYFEGGFGTRTQLNTKENQSLLSIDAFKIFNLNEKNSIYIRINSSALNSKTYFENELLRFGGINSIRGFEENSIYSTLFGLINTEYRYKINNSIYIHTITDVAYFQNKIANTQEKLYGFGFGFGILTKSGLLKFNYANGKTEDTQFKLSNSKIHLSLTANF
jgi:hypothetical protein